jgi:diguanylate cyclase
MERMSLRFLLLSLAIFVGSGAFASGPLSFDQKLAQADLIRSTDYAKFSALVKQLEKESAQASPLQRQRLKYLQAYRTGVYLDKPQEAIGIAKEIYKETKDVTLKYRSGSLIASLSAIKRDFSVGLRYLDRVMPLRDRVADKNIRHEGIGAAAMFYNQLGQYEVGLKYADEVLSAKPAPRSYCGAGYVRLESRFELGLLRGDVSEIEKTIQRCSEIKENIFAGFSTVIMARTLAAAGKPQEAIGLLERALPGANASSYPRLIAEFRAILAELRLQAGDRASARAHAEAAVALGNQIISTASLVSAYRTLYRLAESEGDAVAALALHKKYAEADRMRQSDVKAKELAYEIVRQETQQKTQRIELLERKYQVLQLEQKLERESAQKARLAMVFLMLVLAGLVYWAIQIKRHQAQLRRLAQTDTLTGIGNRHYFTQKSERALLECARAGEQASLIMFDLDHFKAINDTYGHGAGDWVLKHVGKTCLAHCRKIDYIGRIGGEEFAVLLRGLDLAGAARLAEDCRAQLANIDTRDSGYSFVITASFGVTSTALSGYDLSRLMSHADQMLYRAKKEGRNRVCAYSTDVGDDVRPSRRATPALSVINNNG